MATSAFSIRNLVRRMYPCSPLMQRTTRLCGPSTEQGLLGEQDTSLLDAPACEFEIEFQRALEYALDIGLRSSSPPKRKIAATITIAAPSSILPLGAAVSETSAAIKRAFILYTLATITSSASLLTQVEQLVYRES